MFCSVADDVVKVQILNQALAQNPTMKTGEYRFVPEKSIIFDAFSSFVSTETISNDCGFFQLAIKVFRI